MFSMKRREVTPSDELLREISDLLFPPFRNEELKGEKYAIDSSVDTNIEAVLTDLQDGYIFERYSRSYTGPVSFLKLSIKWILP